MLLIHHQPDPHCIYSHYLTALLRSEGFVDFVEAELATLNETILDQHDLVLLPRLTPTQAQTELLTHYVVQGGRLLALLPATNLVERLGLNATFRGLNGGYLQLTDSEPIVQGLCQERVQIIGPVVRWAKADDANVTILAEAHADRVSSSERHDGVIILSRIGRGEAIMVAYDLAHTVARLRQGNPDQAEICFAGLDGIYRPSELFVGQLDPDQAHLPQADLHCALLSRLIEHLAPRPRVWYYPQANQRSTMIMTSDDDWSKLDQFDTLLAGLRKRQAHCTFYIVPNSHVTRELVDAWEADGHTFSVHPTLDSDLGGLATGEPQRLNVAAMIEKHVARHQQMYGRVPRTVRHHAIRWLGYVEAAEVLAAQGVKMDFNYLNVHPFTLGYMTGSGRPMRFVDTAGQIIPYFQQASQWTEETLIHPKFVFSLKWSVEKALAETTRIIQQAAREFYTPFTLNSHPVSFATYSSPLVEGVWDAALAEGMSIISADEWLAWTEQRDAVRLAQVDDGWVLSAPVAISEMTLLLPTTAAIGFVDQTTTQRLWGRDYQALTLHNLAAGEPRGVIVGIR